MLPRLNIAWAEQFVILPDTVRGYMAQPWYKNCAFGCFGRQSAPVLSQNLNPDILMMQPAKDWNRCDASGLLRAPKVRSIFIQRKMGPNFVVI
jgi:hypothetical protein